MLHNCLLRKTHFTVRPNGCKSEYILKSRLVGNYSEPVPELPYLISDIYIEFKVKESKYCRFHHGDAKYRPPYPSPEFGGQSKHGRHTEGKNNNPSETL